MAKFGFRGKFKVTFFALRLHWMFPSYLFSFFGNISSLSKWTRKYKSNPDCANLTWTFDYMRREGLYRRIIEKEGLNDEGIDYLEFGVSKGISFRWWVENITHADTRFYGFDTFDGLPEAWGSFKKGSMSNGNKPPEIEGTRHQFYQGLFQQTFLPFLKDYKGDRRKVIHMDADLYSATWFVLSQIYPYLKSGDIIFFDEFNVPMHEWKAFKEWTESFYIDYEVLGSVNNFYHTCVKIK